MTSGGQFDRFDASHDSTGAVISKEVLSSAESV